MTDERQKIADQIKGENPILRSERAAEILRLSKLELRRTFLAHEEKRASFSFYELTRSRGSALAFGVVLGMCALFVTQKVFLSSPRMDFSREKMLISELEGNSRQTLSSVVFSAGQIQSVNLDGIQEHGEQREVIALSLKSNGEQVKIIAASGSRVEITVGGKKIQLEILDGSKGEIIIFSNDGFWSSAGTRSGELGRLSVKTERISL